MDSPYLRKDAAILIVGTGTFGLSTAWHLARRGFTNITCLDRFPYPSPDSAGFDINKIVGMRNDTPLTARISREALDGWRQPLFAAVWHEVGLITAATQPAQIAYCRAAYESWRQCGEAHNVRWLETPADFRALVPSLGTGPGIVPGWKGFVHRRAGWPAAKEALRVVGDEARKRGVRFVSGPRGTMQGWLADAQGRAQGIVAADGTRWEADRIVLCTGAWTDALLDTAHQLEARCWTVAHLQLTPDECRPFAGQPILMNLDEGFFFEPNEDGQLKLCNEFPGFTHRVTLPDGRVTSRPRSHAQHPGDSIPDQSRAEIRALLAKTLPARFRDRPFVEEKVCWCADSMDREWLITVHPQHPKVILGTGDSGLGFKVLPTIGKYLGDLVEGQSLEPMLHEAWRWRPEKRDRKKRVGGDGQTKDLQDMDGWKEGEVKSLL